MKPSWNFKGAHLQLPCAIPKPSSKIQRTYYVTPDEVRFWAKVEKGEGCWTWLAAKRSDGYGAFDGYAAHRWVARNVLGVIPDHKMVVDHICRNKLCVRPDHLRLVTAKENQLNSSLTHAAQTHCVRGHKLAGKNLYVWRGRRYCRACRAKRY